MIIDAGDNILTLRDEQKFPEMNIFGRLCSPERKQPRLQLLSFCRVKFGRRYPLKLAFAAKPVPEKLRLIVENVAGKIYYKPIKLLLLILPSIDEKLGGTPETKTQRGTAVTRPIGRGALGGMCAGGKPGRVRLRVVRR
jgi:hypothetical protein